LESFQIYKNLAWLNDLPVDKAEAVFRDCCGSREWARRMAESRPFPMLEDLFGRATRIWYSLSPADHLEAFASHPKIGSKSPAPGQMPKAAEWSSGEQAGAVWAAANVLDELSEANRLYIEKFGFIFIICATGKSAEEMLAICVGRLENSAGTEMKIAADEQQKITEIRLNKLLQK
jgi:OHCU decarboxylase